jgi:hypothetical protein
MSKIVDVLENPAFVTAFVVAFAGALVVLFLSRRHDCRGPLPVGGWLIAGATFAGLVHSDALVGDRFWLAVGALLLAVAPATWLLRFGSTAHAVVLLAGAASVAVAAGSVDDRTWVRALVLAATAIGSLVASRIDRRYCRLGLGPVLFAITAVGVFACVPDTEQAIPLLAASGAALVALWPPVGLRLGASGAYLGVGLVVWTAAVGGVGRPGSVIGGIGCLGVFLFEPVTRALSGDRNRFARAPERTGEARDAVALAIVHVVTVLFCARVAGFQSSALPAAALVLLACASGVAALALVRRATS